jgi:hypothetical protein
MFVIQDSTFGNDVLNGAVSLAAQEGKFVVTTVYTTVPDPRVFRLLGECDPEEFETLEAARRCFESNVAAGNFNAEAALVRSREVFMNSCDVELMLAVARRQYRLTEIKDSMTEEVLEESDTRCVSKYTYQGVSLVFTYLECDVFVDYFLMGEKVDSWLYDFESGYWPEPEELFERIVT